MIGCFDCEPIPLEIKKEEDDNYGESNKMKTIPFDISKVNLLDIIVDEEGLPVKLIDMHGELYDFPIVAYVNNDHIRFYSENGEEARSRGRLLIPVKAKINENNPVRHKHRGRSRWSLNLTT